jgi:hypothetical protein
MRLASFATAALSMALAWGPSGCGGRSGSPPTAQAEAGSVDAGVDTSRDGDIDARIAVGIDASTAGTDASTEAADASPEAAVGFCLVAGDCPMHAGPQVYCCTDNVCGSNVPEACADGGEEPVVASNYDQTCTTDTDCVPIAEGNACSMVGPCLTGLINKSSLARYQADTAGVPCYGLSNCIEALPQCCMGGSCQMGSVCALTSPTDDSACVDAGGVCSNNPFAFQCDTVAGLGVGPPNSCPDSKICCLQQ